MFDILIRELSARFGLGDKSTDLLRIVIAYMTNKETGGLTGFLERFKGAGLGPVVQSWLGNTVSPQALNNTQVESVLGSSGGLLDVLAQRIDAPRDNLAGAAAYLIPGLVAKLTPGGSIPSALPADVTNFVGNPAALLAPVTAAASEATSGGLTKWLPWLVGAVALLVGLSYCSKKSADTPTETPPAQTAPAQTASDQAASDQAAPVSFGPEPDASAAAPAAPAMPVASEAASVASAATPAASEGAVTLALAPEGAAVMAGNAHGVPLVQVFFDSGKTDVASEFAAKSTELVAYLKANTDAKAVISGFNDPTGDPVKNAELSKQRAQAVQAALVAQGIDASRTLLEKPVDTTGSAETNAASRRVDVVVRP